MFGSPRSLKEPLLKDLRKKFVFLSGPRQVGKTTLAKQIVAEKKGLYLLYDDENDRTKILNKDYVSSGFVCLDEFHKFPRWKAHLKGVYDKYHDSLSLLLTGSARLDIYQKSGDSLFGRYYLHHLHPLTLREVAGEPLPNPPDDVLQTDAALPGLDELLAFGGFPEPFYTQSEEEHRRWSNARRQLLIREDLRDLTQVHLFGLLEHLLILLPRRIGALFSYRSLSEDLRVSPQTVQNWLDIFERLFLVYKITPYAKNIIRSLKKQPKYYLVDWSQIPDPSARFENLVAGHLWKAVQTWTDLGKGNFSLHFIRDRDQNEVDFLVTKDEKPHFLAEVKISETRFSENLRYFSQRLNIPGIQIVHAKDAFRQEGRLLLISADRWLGLLP